MNNQNSSYGASSEWFLESCVVFAMAAIIALGVLKVSGFSLVVTKYFDDQYSQKPKSHDKHDTDFLHLLHLEIP